MSFKIFRAIFFIFMGFQTVLSFYTFGSETSKNPLSVVFTGGSSLGAYQAGFFYRLNHLNQKKINGPKVVSLSGSSAGAINALLAVQDVCSDHELIPEESLSYQIWTKFVLKNIFDKNEKSPTAILTRKKIEPLFNEVAKIWAKGFPRDCNLVLNFSATRGTTETIQIRGGLLLNRAEETFSLRIQGRGLGRPPKISNLTPIQENAYTSLLDFKHGNFDHNFGVMTDLITASAAFPYFFAQKSIGHCQIDKTSTQKQICTGNLNLRKEPFFDGALIRSSPLNSILSRTTKTPTTDPSRSKSLLEHLIISSQPRTSSSQFAGESSMSGFISKLISNYSNTVDDTYLLEELSSRTDVLVTKSQNYLPRAGEPFLGFFGFLDAKLLEFDFIVGMIEAELFFKNRNRLSVLATEAKYQEDSFVHSKKECLKELLFFGRDKCDNIRDPDFLKLYNLMVTTLKVECSNLKSRFGSDLINPVCPRVSKLRLSHRQKRRKKESRLKYSFRQLNNQKFVFNDYSGTNTQRLPLEIRHEISKKISKVQKNRDSPYARDIGLFETALLLNAYVPRKSYFSVLAGDVLEFSYKYNLAFLNFLNSNHLRYSVSLQLDNFDSAAQNSNSTQNFSVSPFVGLEYSFASGPLVEPTVGAQIGFEHQTQPTEQSIKGKAQLFAAASFFEKFRLQLSFDFNLYDYTHKSLVTAGFEF